VIAVMEDAGFVIASYVITFGGMGLFAAWVLRRGRALATQLPDEDKQWT
jgi:heme exporter protein CcmD